MINNYYHKNLFYNDREIESYKLLNMLCAKYDDNDNFEFITVICL